MSPSHKVSNNRDIERQYRTSPLITATSAQHEYLESTLDNERHLDGEIFSLDTVEDYDSIVREDIGPRTIGRKVKSKHSRDGKARNYLNGDDYIHDDEDSDSSEQQGDIHSPIVRLPPEVLTRILARLDPTSLSQCSSVCKAFARVARDEATWRLAFALAFHIENTGAPTTPILRRVDSTSWKSEYSKRTQLLRCV
jgi:hypothetical protein